MPGETEEFVTSVGLELVSRLAPEELPLYPSLAAEFTGSRGARRHGSSEDQLLGFGAGEAITLLTPVILGFTRSFWQALFDEAAHTAVDSVLRRLRALRTGHEQEKQEAPRLTSEQLRLVRTVADREARRLDISAEQAGLLADAMVGVLTTAPVS
jgi:hypothetical protein